MRAAIQTRRRTAPRRQRCTRAGARRFAATGGLVGKQHFWGHTRGRGQRAVTGANLFQGQKTPRRQRANFGAGAPPRQTGFGGGWQFWRWGRSPRQTGFCDQPNFLGQPVLGARAGFGGNRAFLRQTGFCGNRALGATGHFAGHGVFTQPRVFGAYGHLGGKTGLPKLPNHNGMAPASCRGYYRGGIVASLAVRLMIQS